jgi:hypothetical protein
MHFEEWFAAQFGRRPAISDCTDAELRQKIKDGKRAESEFKLRLEYDRQINAVFKAWLLTDSYKRSSKP